MLGQEEWEDGGIKMQLSPEERETIISFDETPDDATIFTFSRTWQRHLENKLGLVPTMTTKEGAREYHLPKKRIRMPQPKKILSEEQRQKLGKRLRETRHQKSPEMSRNNVTTMKLKGEKSGTGNQSRKKRQP